jgi:serine/threonine protein kinase
MLLGPAILVLTVVLLTKTPKASPSQLRLQDGRKLLEAGQAAEALPIFGYLAKHAKADAERQEASLWLARTLELLDSPGQAKDAYMSYLLKYSQQLSTNKLKEVQHAMGRLLQGQELKHATAADGSAWQQFLSQDGALAAMTEALAKAQLTQSSDDEPPTAEATPEEGAPTALAIERTRRDVSLLDTGQKVGDYVIAEKLGQGGFGDVYRAILPVAIKFARNSDSVERLRRFSDLQSKVDSDRIVKPLTINLQADPPYVVMELVDGPNLRALMLAGPVAVPTALALAEDLALALRDAHAAGVCHLDLKPENVLLDPSGVVKLTDFELGRLDVGALQQSLAFATQAGNPAGTLVYMSPEQRAGKQADARSDVFTFGVMLFELLTGTLPEPGDKPSQFVDGLPVSVDAIFERCFARQERRYASAADVLLDLRAVRLEQPDVEPLADLFGRVSEEAIAQALTESEATASPEHEAVSAPEPLPESRVEDESAPAPESAPDSEPEPVPTSEAREAKESRRPPLEELLARQRLAKSPRPGKDYEGDSEPRRLAEPPQSA